VVVVEPAPGAEVGAEPGVEVAVGEVGVDEVGVDEVGVDEVEPGDEVLGEVPVDDGAVVADGATVVVLLPLPLPALGGAGRPGPLSPQPARLARATATRRPRRARVRYMFVSRLSLDDPIGCRRSRGSQSRRQPVAPRSVTLGGISGMDSLRDRGPG
jgi:hypothetical protein